VLVRAWTWTLFNTVAAPAGPAVVALRDGSVGLSSAMAAAIAGCEPIIAVDVRPERLALADPAAGRAIQPIIC